jgi:CheY-like chemotaxis protein
MSIRELLSYDDIEIDTAGTGNDALASLRGQDYDCVVLDLRLPDMTGFEVLEEIKRDESLSDVRWSCSPDGSSRPRRTRSCTPWRAASW